MSLIKLRVQYHRLLRSFSYIAQKNHGPCPICNYDIEEGQRYEGRVFLLENGIKIDKFHSFCPHDFLQEEAEEMERLLRSEEERDSSREEAVA